MSERRICLTDAGRVWTARTRDGLTAAKRKGEFGTAGSVETAARASAARSEQATKTNATTRAVIAEIRRPGRATLAAIAQELKACGVRTPGRS